LEKGGNHWDIGMESWYSRVKRINNCYRGKSKQILKKKREVCTKYLDISG